MKTRTSVLKAVNDIMCAITDSASVKTDAEGWHLSAISPDHVCMVKADIASTAFIDYEPCGDFDLDCSALRTLLRNVGTECSVELENGNAVLAITSDGLKQKAPLIAGSADPPKIPDIELTTECLVEESMIRRILKAAPERADALSVSVSEEGVVFSAEKDGREADFTIPAEECIEMSGSGKGSYPLATFRSFIAAVPAGSILDITLETDYPLRAVYGESQLYEVRWLVAPRIENE